MESQQTCSGAEVFMISERPPLPCPCCWPRHPPGTTRGQNLVQPGGSGLHTTSLRQTLELLGWQVQHTPPRCPWELKSSPLVSGASAVGSLPDPRLTEDPRLVLQMVQIPVAGQSQAWEKGQAARVDLYFFSVLRGLQALWSFPASFS